MLGNFYCGGIFLYYIRIAFSKSSVMYQDVALTVFLFFDNEGLTCPAV